MAVAAQSEKITFNREQILVAALLFLMILLNYLDRQILSVLAPVMRKELGLSQMDYATAVNAFLLAYAFMYAGSGLVLDRIGSRRGLAIFVTLWSVASALHATVGGLAGLLVFRFLLGVAEPGGWTGAVKSVAERFTATQRGLASGIFTSGAGVGALIAPPLIVFLSLRYGWRFAFLVVSAAGLAWVPLWLEATRRTLTAPQRQTRGIAELLSPLGDRRVLPFVATRFFGDSSAYFFLFWLPEYLVTTKNFSFRMLGAVGWIPFLWSDIGAVAGGYLSGRLVQAGRSPLLSRKVMMTVAPVLVALGVLLQTFSSGWAFIVSLSLATFGVGIWSGNLHSVPADAYPARMVATVHGLAGSAGSVGGILFNTLVGYFSARGNYSVIFLVLVLLEPLGVLPLWLWLREGKLHSDADTRKTFSSQPD